MLTHISESIGSSIQKTSKNIEKETMPEYSFSMACIFQKNSNMKKKYRLLGIVGQTQEWTSQVEHSNHNSLREKQEGRLPVGTGMV